MPPILVGWVIDSLNNAPPAFARWFIDTTDAWPMAIFLAVLGVLVFALESLFQYFYQYGFLTLAQRVQHDLRVETYSALQQREMAFFDNHRIGDSMTMLNDDVNQLERFLNTGFNEFVQLAVLFGFAGFVLLQTSWQLALVGMAPVPLIILGSLWYQRLISPRYRKVRQAVGSLSSRLENNIGGILVIKSFTAEEFEKQRVASESESYQEANLAAIKLSSVYVPLIRLLIAIGFGLVLLLGSYWVLNDSKILTIGELVSFSMMIQRLLWPLTRLGIIFDDYERSSASALRVFSMLEAPKAINDVANFTKNNGQKGKIEFNKVDFAYKKGLPVLQQLDFTAASQETIGFAGTTGAGKSTLIKLLLRFYDVTGGSIKIDGVDIREMRQKDLRSLISLVSQDVYLFYGTIFENIAYSNPDISLDEVIAAAKQAELHRFVNSLPDKYDTIIGERGLKLSGGQRQRLSIARALLKNAPIIVLDEATSSVDTETERAIQTNLQKITAGRTALVIAHRLSTIRKADRILVLDRGKVAEMGSHDELLAHHGKYAELWSVQVGG